MNAIARPRVRLEGVVIFLRMRMTKFANRCKKLVGQV